ncbi:MAG: DUF1254 domain-containing protein [Pirellulales bacterium]|nr:DUF1254 domain-containing protein [Pirellulales bacterium]
MKLVTLTLLAAVCIPAVRAADVTPHEARAIAKQAYIYGYPMVDGYRVQYTYFVDKEHPNYKCPWNQINNNARVNTPEDRTVQTPNSDTPYSQLGLDLRAEPWVLTVPAIESERYFSVQLIDLYTHNFAYVGTRTTGNGGGRFLIAGPDWKGRKPPGITKVIQSESELVYAIFRTQLFNPGDIENVKKVQAGYRVRPLSAFLGRPAPKAAPPIDWIKPLKTDEQAKSLEVFNILSFVLRFCPEHPSEKTLRAKFASIGIGPGKKLDFLAMPETTRAAYQQGVADAWEDFAELQKKADSGELTSADAFGTREELKNNYLLRWAGAVLGIYGNSAAEAIYPLYFVDADQKPLDAFANRYTLRFGPGKLPPVNAFWSVTMYDLPDRFLVANPLNRYLINSPMLSQLRKDADGGLTIYIQHESPGKEEANWLPAPKGPFFMSLRLYYPKREALNGQWEAPKAQRAKTDNPSPTKP